MVRRSSTRIALVMSSIALVACGSDDHSKSGSKVESSGMTKPNYEPTILTAFADKAYLVRQVAAVQGVHYDETPVPGRELITFSFKKLNRASADKGKLHVSRTARRKLYYFSFLTLGLCRVLTHRESDSVFIRNPPRDGSLTGISVRLCACPCFMCFRCIEGHEVCD
jgi:hypothetical protein